MKKPKKCKKNIRKNNNYNGRNVYGQPCIAKFVKLEKETALDQYLAILADVENANGNAIEYTVDSSCFTKKFSKKREEDKRAVPPSELKSLPHELSSLPDEQNSLQGDLAGSQPNKEIYNIDKIYNINQIIKDSTQDGTFVF